MWNVECPDFIIQDISLGSQHSYSQSRKKRVRNVRKSGKDRKPGKANGSIISKRKSETGSSNSSKDKSIKHSVSAGTHRISGKLLKLKSIS